MKAFITTILLIFVVTPVAFSQYIDLTQNSGSMSAQTQRPSWPGSWWSMSSADLALGWDDGNGRERLSIEFVSKVDACLASYSKECTRLIDSLMANNARKLSPLLKFDLFVHKYVEMMTDSNMSFNLQTHAAKRELEIHYIDGPDHPHYEVAGYAGKCTGWALSNFDFPEPSTTKNILGIDFTPADIKGILATIYNGAQFFVSESIGNSYRNDGVNDSQEFFDDVSPDDFIRALFLTLGQGKMLEADLDPGDGVWNYPIHAFELHWIKSKKDKLTVNVKIYLANDEVDVDATYALEPFNDAYITKDYMMEVSTPNNWDGDLMKVTNGKWIDESKNNHPDVLILGLEKNWRKDIYQYRNTSMKEEVNFQLIKRVNIKGKGWVPIVDILLNDYYL